MKVGDTIEGSKVYGKNNKLTGEIIKIEKSTNRLQSRYEGDDIVTIQWVDGQVAKFDKNKPY